MARTTTSVRLGAACDRACAPCDCRDSPSACDAAGVPAAVDDGGERLVVRGEALLDPALDPTLERARGAGWGEVWVRSHGGALTDPARARWLRERGVRGVVLPVFSQASRAHDAVAGRPGALVDVLRAARVLADAGLAVASETPLLEARLQDLAALVDLLRRATEAYARARFYVPRRVMPAALAPPRWADAAPRLAAAIARSDALGVAVELDADDGLPLARSATTPRSRRACSSRPRAPGGPTASRTARRARGAPSPTAATAPRSPTTPRTRGPTCGPSRAAPRSSTRSGLVRARGSRTSARRRGG